MSSKKRSEEKSPELSPSGFDHSQPDSADSAAGPSHPLQRKRKKRARVEDNSFSPDRLLEGMMNKLGLINPNPKGFAVMNEFELTDSNQQDFAVMHELELTDPNQQDFAKKRRIYTLGSAVSLSANKSQTFLETQRGIIAAHSQSVSTSAQLPHAEPSTQLSSAPPVEGSEPPVYGN